MGNGARGPSVGIRRLVEVARLVPAASLDASHILGGSHGHFCGTDRPLSVIAGMPTINLPRSGLLEQPVVADGPLRGLPLNRSVHASTLHHPLLFRRQRPPSRPEWTQHRPSTGPMSAHQLPSESGSTWLALVICSFPSARRAKASSLMHRTSPPAATTSSISVGSFMLPLPSAHDEGCSAGADRRGDKDSPVNGTSAPVFRLMSDS